jgi:hypothetical protein
MMTVLDQLLEREEEKQKKMFISKEARGFIEF